MATVPHVTSGLGLRKFLADGFLLTRVYMSSCMLFLKEICYNSQAQDKSDFIKLSALISRTQKNVDSQRKH